MEPAESAVEDRIVRVREAGEDVYVTDLIRAAREAGASRPQALRLAVRAAADPERQQTWEDWEKLSDQSEIALRLRVLLETPALRGELEDFLTFFFRASAPEVYRYACLAVGRHSWENATCEQHLRSYAERSGVDFGGPVDLTGKRSRRRLLLAFTERYLHAPEGQNQVELPAPSVRSDRPDGGAVPADVAAHCIAAERLVDSERGPPEFVATAWELLRDIDASLNRGGSQRSLVRAWGGLLRALADRDAERAASIWTGRLAVFEGRMESGFSGRLASLWELDALVSVAVEEGDALLEAAGLDDLGEAFEGSSFRWFARIRHWQWQQRREDRAEYAPEVETVTGDVDPVLRQFVDEVYRAVREGASYHDAMHRWIGGAVSRLGTPERWWGEPAGSRALSTFFLLDAVRYRPPPRATILEMLEAAGIARSTERSSNATGGLEGAPWEGFHDLLWHIFALEGAPPDFPIESESLTSIATAERLLGFVRAGQTVRDADILVDALEHFVRLELASEPSFDLEAFLYRVAARKPHASVFREFADRTRGRTYRRADGSSVPLEDAIEALAAEVEHTGGSATDAETFEWFPELHASRRTLQEAVAVEDLCGALEEFADQIDPRIPDPVTHRRGLVELVGWTSPEGGAVLLDSEASRTRVSFEELSSGVAEDVRALREATARLFDDPQAELAEMHRAARNAVQQLRRIEERLGPCVAERDRRILERGVDDLCDRIGAWTSALERDVGDPLGEIESPDAEVIDEVFEGLARRKEATLSGADRARLVRVAYELLQLRGRASATAEDDLAPIEENEWYYRKQLLVSAAAALDGEDDSESVVAFLVDRWEQLADIAMEAQAEPAVLELARREELARLRSHAADGPTFERVEHWLMDRYHVGAVASMVSDRRSGRVAPIPPLGVAAVRMATNFGHVWLALLVGAVMLLDFGDAWVEMARAGDMPGIAATFGIGVGGTFLYLLADIAAKTDSTFEVASWRTTASRLLRALTFLGVCFLYALGVTSGLWYLFSGTDVVLHGPGARLHILVWTGFALFVGIFFGLLTESA